MNFRPRGLVFLLILLYLVVVFLYPTSRDEAIYSVLGKNIENFQLYKELFDHKPPGIFLTTFLISKIPISQFFVTRLVVFIATLLTAFTLMKLSENLFNPEYNFLLCIPIFYILFSIFYLGGLLPIVETFETLFVVSSLYFFFKSRKEKYQNMRWIILSSLLIFMAFQYKQTALLFLLIPSVILLYERKIKEFFAFIAVFAFLFALLIIILNNLGILDSYINLVWLYTLSRGANSVFSLESKLVIPIILAAPLLILSLPGAFSSFERKVTLKGAEKKITLIAVLITSALVFISILMLFRNFSTRFYFLELTPLLLLFIPLTFSNLNKQKILRFAVILSVLLLIILFVFIFLKVLGLFGGYNSWDNFSDVAYLDSIITILDCEKVSGSVDYWYLSSMPQPDMKYVLGTWNLNYIVTLESLDDYKDSFKKYIKEGKTCYVNYLPQSLYSIPGIYEQSPHQNPMFDIAEELCTCNHLDQKSSNSAICCNCGKN